MKATYYIVQTSPSEFLGRSCGKLGREPARAAEDALRLTLPEARSVFRAACKTINITDGWGRRFPRIIKVTTETKTIKERQK